MGWHRMREHEPRVGDSVSGAAVERPGGTDAGADTVFWASPVGQAARAKLRGDHFFQIELDDSAVGAQPVADPTVGGRRARRTCDLLGQIEELGWHLEHVAWWRIDPDDPTAQVAQALADRHADHVRGVYLFHAVPEAEAHGGRHAAPPAPTHRREVV